MVTDYFFLRREKLDLNNYYNKEGRFKGVNWAGILAVFVGAGFSLIFLDLSWYISLIPTSIIYYLAMKHMKIVEDFRKDTIFDKN